jgi:hypothetical protein
MFAKQLLTTKTKNYESRIKIIRCIINYSLLGSVFYNIIFYTLSYENNNRMVRTYVINYFK